MDIRCIPNASASGRLLGVSRAGVALLLLLAVGNGVFLYLAPAKAATAYAWSVQPPISAAFMGAGYLAGTVATGLVMFATRRWRSLRTLPLALVVLSAMLMTATIVHADRFRWDYAPTWVWTSVYAGVPLIVALLWWLQERDAEPVPAPDPGLRVVRTLSAVLGGVLVAGAALLFVLPEVFSPVWPWSLTPLLARVVAAWHAMVGTALLVCARTLRAPQEAIIPYATLAAWSLLLLALPLSHGDAFIREQPALLWVAVIDSLLVLSLLALARAAAAARSLGLRL